MERKKKWITKQYPLLTPTNRGGGKMMRRGLLTVLLLVVFFSAQAEAFMKVGGILYKIMESGAVKAELKGLSAAKELAVRKIGAGTAEIFKSVKAIPPDLLDEVHAGTYQIGVRMGKASEFGKIAKDVGKVSIDKIAKDAEAMGGIHFKSSGKHGGIFNSTFSVPKKGEKIPGRLVKRKGDLNSESLEFMLENKKNILKNKQGKYKEYGYSSKGSESSTSKESSYSSIYSSIDKKEKKFKDEIADEKKYFNRKIGEVDAQIKKLETDKKNLKGDKAFQCGKEIGKLKEKKNDIKMRLNDAKIKAHKKIYGKFPEESSYSSRSSESSKPSYTSDSYSSYYSDRIHPSKKTPGKAVKRKGDLNSESLEFMLKNKKNSSSSEELLKNRHRRHKEYGYSSRSSESRTFDESNSYSGDHYSDPESYSDSYSESYSGSASLEDLLKDKRLSFEESKALERNHKRNMKNMKNIVKDEYKKDYRKFDLSYSYQDKIFNSNSNKMFSRSELIGSAVGITIIAAIAATTIGVSL